MADADRGVELHLVAGVGPCLYCGVDQLATPDEEPAVGSVVFCGGCAGLHYLGELDGEPFIYKPNTYQLLELLKRPDVQAVRDAYQLDQMEARMARAATKSTKMPTPPRTGGKVRPGLNRLEARGPDA